MTSGVDELSRALPWLQPLALTSPTRDAIGKNGVNELRTTLIDRCQIPAEEPAKLQRVDGKTLFIVATVVLSGWFLVRSWPTSTTSGPRFEPRSIEWGAGGSRCRSSPIRRQQSASLAPSHTGSGSYRP